MALWEFSSAQDVDLGFTFNEPSINPLTGAYRQIAKVADDATANATGVWRVVVGNGYGSNNGRAFLYFLNASTGTPTNKILASNGPNNGLSAPTPADTDGDGLVDTIYAGDVRGNMHKFQFSVQSGADFVLASPGKGSGAAWRYIGVVYASGEPITTAPTVAASPDGIGSYVTFGTGKFNEDTDFADSSPRGFYAVLDKAPSSNLTVLNNQLANITYTTAVNSTTGISTRNWSQPNLSNMMGWKISFTAGERVLSNSTLPPNTGTVLFATTKPNGDVCDPSNSGFLMAVNLTSGAGGKLLVGTVQVGGVSVKSSGVVKVSNTFTNLENKQQVVLNQEDFKGSNAPTILPSMAPRGRYSWREILTK
jgi:type IV pilus assembly protein PilY1